MIDPTLGPWSPSILICHIHDFGNDLRLHKKATYCSLCLRLCGLSEQCYSSPLECVLFQPHLFPSFPAGLPVRTPVSNQWERLGNNESTMWSFLLSVCFMAGLVLGSQLQVDSLDFIVSFLVFELFRCHRKYLTTWSMQTDWVTGKYIVLSPIFLPPLISSLSLPFLVFHFLELYICGSTKHICFHLLGCFWDHPYCHMYQWLVPGHCWAWRYWKTVVIICLCHNKYSLPEDQSVGLATS